MNTRINTITVEAEKVTVMAVVKGIVSGRIDVMKTASITKGVCLQNFHKLINKSIELVVRYCKLKLPRTFILHNVSRFLSKSAGRACAVDDIGV